MEVKAIAAADTYSLRSAVLRPGLPIEANHYPGDASGWHLGLFANQSLLGVVTIYPEDNPNFLDFQGHWRIRGMAILPEYRSRGYGAVLLKALLEKAKELPLIWCNARTPALSFYLRHGFTVESEEFSLPHIGPHRLLKYLPQRPDPGGNSV